MSEKIRNYAIAIAVLVAVAIYAFMSLQHWSYTRDYRQAALNCASKNNNYQYKDNYATCMLYNGYDQNVNFNYNQNHDF